MTPAVFNYTYDSFGRVDTKSYPTGINVKHNYNSFGYLTRLTNVTAANSLLWQLKGEYDDRGTATLQYFGNNITTQSEFDEASGRIKRITAGLANGMPGAVQNLAYNFDSIGNLASRSTNQYLEQVTEEFEYDDLNRIKVSTTRGLGFNGIRIKEYDYDVLGNLKSMSNSQSLESLDLKYEMTNGAGVHAVTSVNGQSYNYDVFGNMTSRVKKDGSKESISYDVFNKPTKIGVDSYKYGADHQLIRKYYGVKSTYYVGGGEYEEVNVRGRITRRSYIAGIILHEQTGTDDNVFYLHKDHLGSTQSITDENGNLVNNLSYGVWGDRQKSNWETGEPDLSDLPTSQGFTGHEHIGSELIHMGGRVYDSSIGRFLTPDLFIQSPTNTQSFNRYTYVFNNPLSLVDPTGYSSEDKVESISDDDIIDSEERAHEDKVIGEEARKVEEKRFDSETIVLGSQGTDEQQAAWSDFLAVMDSGGHVFDNSDQNGTQESGPLLDSQGLHSFNIKEVVNLKHKEILGGSTDGYEANGLSSDDELKVAIIAGAKGAIVKVKIKTSLSLNGKKMVDRESRKIKIPAGGVVVVKAGGYTSSSLEKYDMGINMQVSAKGRSGVVIIGTLETVKAVQGMYADAGI